MNFLKKIFNRKESKLEYSLKVLARLCSTAYGGGGVEIRYSDVSGQYYLAVPFHIKRGGFLTKESAHHDTISRATDVFMENLRGKTIVFNPDSDEHRKEMVFISVDLTAGEYVIGEYK